MKRKDERRGSSWRVSEDEDMVKKNWLLVEEVFEAKKGDGADEWRPRNSRIEFRKQRLPLWEIRKEGEVVCGVSWTFEI